MIEIVFSENFWEVNPNVRFAEPFRSLYEQDKSKKKETSSSMMWVCAALVSPKSIFRNMEDEEKHREIEDSGICHKGFIAKNKKKITELCDALEKLVFSTPAKRALKIWEQKMVERAEFIKGTTYSRDTYQMIDGMMGATDKLYKDYNRILKELEGEVEEQGLGNREKSFLEQERDR